MTDYDTIISQSVRSYWETAQLLRARGDLSNALECADVAQNLALYRLESLARGDFEPTEDAA